MKEFIINCIFIIIIVSIIMWALTDRNIPKKIQEKCEEICFIENSQDNFF